ncbi:MAG: hypothetical protein LH618_02340 [Saprospiraceae bacterium]|nr:hypothetical protein [Saprospiraceae bacterium]
MRYSIFLFLATLFLVGGCQKERDLGPGFDLQYQQEFNIPVALNVFEVHHFQLKNIPSYYVQSLTQAGKTDADVVGFLTVKGNLGGIFGDADLSFVERMSVRVFNDNNPNDYIEVAYREPTPLDPGNAIPLIPTLADSKRLLTGSRFNIDVVIWLRKSPPTDTDVRLDLQLRAQY